MAGSFGRLRHLELIGRIWGIDCKIRMEEGSE